MSAIAGIMARHSGVITDALLSQLGQCNRHRGPHGVGRFAAPSLAMMHWQLRFDRLSESEHQPCHTVDGHVITFDGRLDNRDELRLQLPGQLSRPDVPDVDFVAAAYAKWGNDAFRRLIGEWSVAIAAPDRCTLTLAKDFAGCRTLYYLTRSDALVYSTCLEALVETFALREEYDESYLAGYLLLGPPYGSTPFQGIKSVPPGSFVLMSIDGAVRTHKYWQFTTGTIRYKDDRQYEEQLRTILSDAVRARLRSKGPVWAELSGGLDSSTVVGVANSLVTSGSVEAPRLQPVSRVSTKSRESDESHYISMMEEHSGLSSLKLDNVDEVLAYAAGHGITPTSADTYYADIADRIAASGGNVLLTGQAGDLVMAKSGLNIVSLLEHLGRGRVDLFLDGCRLWARRTRQPVYGVISMAMSPFWPASLAERRRMRLWRSGLVRSHRCTSNTLGEALALTPYAQELGMSVTNLPPPEVLDVPRSKRLLVTGLWHWVHGAVLASPERLGPVRISHPFVDRRLVEFVLGLPQSVLWSPDATRRLMRRALGTVLPEGIATRETKGNPTAVITRVLRPHVARMLAKRDQWQLVERGFVTHERFSQLLQMLVEGALDTPSYLAKFIALETWLEYRSRPRVTNSAFHSPGPLRSSHGCAEPSSTGSDVVCTELARF